MGAGNSSGVTSGLGASSALVAREVKLLRAMAMLDRDDIAKMVIEINDAGLNLGGREVNVEVVGYSDDHIWWRSGIRFRCSVKDLQSGEELAKEINLRQFIAVYHNVMVSKNLLSTPKGSRDVRLRHRTHSAISPSADDDIEVGVEPLEHEFGEEDTDDADAATSAVDADGGDEDDRLCCVCLERSRQISLPCAHSFCPSCIHEWQLRSNSCPLCREESTVDEQWLLEDGPDLTEMEKELRITLTNLLRSP